MGQGAFLGPQRVPICLCPVLHSLLMQPRISATYLFLNMESWGEVTEGPSGGAPKDSVCWSPTGHLVGPKCNGGSGGHCVLDLPPMEERGVLAWLQHCGREALLPPSKKMEDMGWCSGSVFLLCSSC